MEVGPDWSVRPLAALLGRERQILERLRFQLRVAAVLAESGRIDRIGPPIREADDLLDRLGALELARALEVADAGERLALGGELRLDVLTDASSTMTRKVLCRNGLQLRRLLYEVQALADSVGAHLAGGPDGFSLEALIREGALAVMDRVPPPSLTEFVFGEPVAPNRHRR